MYTREQELKDMIMMAVKTKLHNFEILEFRAELNYEMFYIRVFHLDGKYQCWMQQKDVLDVKYLPIGEWFKVFESEDIVSENMDFSSIINKKIKEIYLDEVVKFQIIDEELLVCYLDDESELVYIPSDVHYTINPQFKLLSLKVFIKNFLYSLSSSK